MCIGLPLAAGCGGGTVAVEGEVTLDGKPVDGATVVFTSDDGANTYSGFTDAAGRFSLSGANSKGALPGNYKVSVVKTPKVAGAEQMTPGGGDYLKQMKKGEKKQSSGPMMPPPPGAAGSGIKSELPAVYAVVGTTPLTAKVPSDGPVKIELKAKP